MRTRLRETLRRPCGTLAAMYAADGWLLPAGCCRLQKTAAAAAAAAAASSSQQQRQHQKQQQRQQLLVSATHFWYLLTFASNC